MWPRTSQLPVCVCVFVPLNVFEQAACVLQIQYLFLSKLFRHKSEPSACRTWKSRTNSCGRPWTTTTTNSPRSRIKVSGQLVSVYVLFLYLNRLWTSHGIPTYHTIYIILVLRYWLARTRTHTHLRTIYLSLQNFMAAKTCRRNRRVCLNFFVINFFETRGLTSIHS